MQTSRQEVARRFRTWAKRCGLPVAHVAVVRPGRRARVVAELGDKTKLCYEADKSAFVQI
jgi:hypothetical protein